MYCNLEAYYKILQMKFCFECLDGEVDYEYSLQYQQQTPKNHD